MDLKLDWYKFKTLVDSVGLSIQYSDEVTQYHLYGYNGTSLICTCELEKIHEGCADFESSYKSLANKPLLTKFYPFSDAGGFRFRGASFTGSVSANTTGDIDYKIVNERYLNGGYLFVSNIGADDKLTFQVIDKDNILGYGANTVLDEFITDFYVPTNDNLEVRLDYPARIAAGLYVRMKYTSTHASGCTIKCNLYLHWKSI